MLGSPSNTLASPKKKYLLKVAGLKFSHSASVIDDRRSKEISTVPEQSELSIDSKGDHGLTNAYDVRDFQKSEDCAQTIPEQPAFATSFIYHKRRFNLNGIPRPASAAVYYNCYSPETEVEEFCDSIHRLNLYLKGRKNDVRAGMPGKFLHAVIGQEVSDVASFISTILYSFYLNETLKRKQLCTVPIINMKRVDLNSHAELKWLLDSSNVDQSSFIFLDEIDLSYYDLLGRLKLVLISAGRLPQKLELFQESLVEVFNCRKVDVAYPWVDNITEAEDCSCCTLVAEKFVLALPRMLSGKGFSRLLLAGILLDTGNLTSPHCTNKDRYISTLLIKGAGRFGCSGLYQILRYKMHDVSDLKVEGILRKDFKKWTQRGRPDVGISSIGISVARLLEHHETSTQEIVHFQSLEKLKLLVILCGYYDTQKNFKREVLVSAETGELVKDLFHFFYLRASHLPLKAYQLPGMGDKMRAFKIEKVTSRRTIERLMEEFCDSTKC